MAYWMYFFLTVRNFLAFLGIQVSIFSGIGCPRSSPLAQGGALYERHRNPAQLPRSTGAANPRTTSPKTRHTAAADFSAAGEDPVTEGNPTRRRTIGAAGGGNLVGGWSGELLAAVDHHRGRGYRCRGHRDIRARHRRRQGGEKMARKDRRRTGGRSIHRLHHGCFQQMPRHG